MTARKVDLLLPLLVVVIAGGAVALVVGLTGTSATEPPAASAVEPGPPTPFEQEDPPARVSRPGQNIPTMATVGEPEIEREKAPRLQPLYPFAPRDTEPKAPPDEETQQKLDELQNRRTPWSNNE